ncbi:MAG TPA: energy transducer TonB, partial [Longimicrobium sp.]|nr:energy transducer TonB [Longimicrobium sp.]
GGGGDGRVAPPEADFLVIPPQRPGNVRSQDIVVRVLVDTRGEVRDVELIPSTGNRGYDDRLRRMAREWRFRPAREVGTNRAVEARTDVTVTI